MKRKKPFDGERVLIGGKRYAIEQMLMVGANLEGSYESKYRMEILLYDKKTGKWFLSIEVGGYMNLDGDHKSPTWMHVNHIILYSHDSAGKWLEKHGRGDDVMWTRVMDIIMNKKD